MKKEKLIVLKFRAITASLLRWSIPLSESIFNLRYGAGKGKKRHNRNKLSTK